MFGKINIDVFVIICILTSTGISAKARRLGGRSPMRKTPCPQDGPFKQFRNSETCSVCTDCKKLGLIERRACTDYKDARCRNVCINRDEKYNRVTSVCEKRPHRKNSATTTVIPTTSKSSMLNSYSTPFDLRKHSTPESLSFKATAGFRSDNRFIIPVAILCGILVVVGVVMVPVSLILRKKLRTRKNHVQL